MTSKKFTTEVGGRTLTAEFTNWAEHANGSCLITYGETSVLATAVQSKGAREGIDFFPLTVDYEEKFYAAGKILGSRFMRREGRPSEEAILSGRLVDRTIRPLFDKRIRRPIQVVATVLSYDGENDPDFVALMAASTALAVSDVPWGGPVGGVSVSKIDDKCVVNPKNSGMTDENTPLRAFFAGTDKHINMIELGASGVSDADVITAGKEAMQAVSELINFQKDVIKKIGKEKTEIKFDEPSAEFVKEVKDYLAKSLEEAVYVKDKKDRSDKVGALKKELKAGLEVKFENDIKHFDMLFEDELDKLVHKNVLDSDKRPDGRSLDEVRDLYSEVGLFQRTHGSGLFVRGNTQALAMTTLGAPGDSQLQDTIEFSGKKRFMLHYNFPPFSVGEARSFRVPGRRDIGHGALAEKAIRPLIPNKEEFPYTVRVVSEILSSNGSSSMATISASSLSLMDAGVTIKAPAA